MSGLILFLFTDVTHAEDREEGLFILNLRKIEKHVGAIHKYASKLDCKPHIFFFL
jgi:hypothetical protein